MCDDGTMTDRRAPAEKSWTPLTEAGRGLLDAVAADPGSVLLALDFDGTLAPIVDDPADSAMAEESRHAMSRMDGKLAIMAIVTGREVAAVRRMTSVDEVPGLEHLVVLGQYGVERYDAASGALRDPEVPESIRIAKGRLEQLIDELAQHDPRDAGCRIEDKGRAVALHTRRAADPAHALTTAVPRVRQIAEELGLHCEDGRNIIELKSAVTTKAQALRELIDEVTPRVVIMCGDDLGDVPALDVISEWIGQGHPGARVVSYSDEQPSMADHADIICDQTEGISAFLEALADQVCSTK
ncbi:trehalose-phosphatase [Cutibacterium equinum]|uniref:Trehalose 6-phosphate phosphatase n=1 Tax=Cutibacterium equinum TaxID=3016342 RepID=A0ABY7R197_9ACTN|nr:trehalose-phosphatase [Cutibacterium equinum]WCC81058.1 trehalose-phosphatase [Cutibacterium equinum]